MQQQVVSQLFDLRPSALLELWSLNGSTANLDVSYTWHDGTNAGMGNLIFNGITYTAFPIKVEQVDKDGKNSLPRPKLSCSNINGFTSIVLLGNNDLIGAAVTRTRIFARNLDAVNFPNGVNPWGTPDSTATVDVETWYVNRKIAENADIVQFELAAAIEIDGTLLPRRQILANSCPIIYRDPETCGYTGVPVSDKNNKLFFSSPGYNYTPNARGVWLSTNTYNQGDYVYMVSTLLQTAGSLIYYVCTVNGTTGSSSKPGVSGAWVADSCSRTMRSCKLRFPTGALRFHGFAGVSRAAYQS